MQTGQRNPLQLPEDEQYDCLSTQLISSNVVQDQNKLLFPALSFSKNFATIAVEAQNITKFYYSINHVFKTMTLAELNTLHTTSEIERTQFLTNCAMLVTNS